MDDLSDPVYESTPKNYRKRSTRKTNFATPHVPLAGGGIKKARVAIEQLNFSNQAAPLDEQSVVNTNVSSSRRSVNKQLAQPRRVTSTGNKSRQNNWMYVNRKETSKSNSRRVSPVRNRLSQSSGRNLKLVQKQQSSQTTGTAQNDKQIRPKKRAAQYSVALKEIRAFQRSTNLLLRKLPFARLVRSITVRTLGPSYLSFHWQAICFLALQEAAEAFIVHLFECAQRCAIHAKRITVMSKDIQLVTHLQNIPTSSQFTHYHHTIQSQQLQLAHLKQIKRKHSSQRRRKDHSQESDVDEDDTDDTS
ncbi:putative centromere protein A (cenp-A) (centromere autoantigen A) [Schistosoma mansoni]|uniref:Putative centromere protein A (Cenp-A) (Centromere autoantigen A) n=1 Tax=Schistosoma mansoni TaxID=6183 RepID=G4VKH6_SCHMA|nr:putative centromere protein A (cenp-A) (centromere autoantigen A) [Schistosoma mansoni]|eukprot:XP_018652785.1 putative centromere protein A (cenp-A) (centromere autoantigen A) [Schistosoma mansoni]